MKILLSSLISCLLSGTALAQIEYEVEEVVFTKLISVSSLVCSTHLGRPVPVEDRTFTVLRETRLTVGSHESIEMDHEGARAAGCDIQILDEIVNESWTRFGFVAAEITVTKGTAKNPRIVFGECQRNYTEQIAIDLGRGIVLNTSRLGKLKPATGCE